MEKATQDSKGTYVQIVIFLKKSNDRKQAQNDTAKCVMNLLRTFISSSILFRFNQKSVNFFLPNPFENNFTVEHCFPLKFHHRCPVIPSKPNIQKKDRKTTLWTILMKIPRHIIWLLDNMSTPRDVHS